MSGFGLENLPYGVLRHGSAPPRVGVAHEDAVLDVAALGLAPELDAPTLGPLLELPFAPGDSVDLYSSLEHAANVGRLLRPGEEPLLPTWRHLPVGHHGRAGGVAVSGTPVVRPCGQLELAFVVTEPGVPRRGRIPAAAFPDHASGFVLLDDWSARDVRVPGPVQEPEPLPSLRAEGDSALDPALEVELDGAPIARVNARERYWSAPRLLAHATVNGAGVRPGDLFASGTEPVGLPGGAERGFLEDGEEVVLRGRAGDAVSFGEVRGRVEPARG